jgi:NCS1 family nucleobase:cation symporter-1
MEQGHTVKKPLIETRSIDFVPDSERRGRVRDQGPFWFLSNFHFFSIAVGFVGPSMGLSLAGTLLASFIGIVIGTTFQAFHATQGPHLGLPQMIQSRAQFGFRGVIVPLFAALLSPLAFNIVAAVLIADGVSHIFGVTRGAVMLAVALASGLLAVFGYDWLHRVFKLLFWISLPLIGCLTIAIATGHAWGNLHPATGFNWPAFFTQLATAASFNLGLAPYVSDYSRYLPKTTSRWNIIGQVFAGSASSAIWLIGLGAWLATRFNATDSLVSMMQAGNGIFHGFGLVLAISSICVLTAVVAMNSYSGMLIFVTAADSICPVNPTKRLRVLAIVGFTVVWGAIATSLNGNAITYVNAAMVACLYALVPWTAVNLVDYFIVRRGQYSINDLFSPQGLYGTWGMRGLVSYALGFLTSIPFFVVPSVFTGLVADRLGGVDIGWLVGLIVSAGAYLAWGALSPVESEAPVTAS